MSGEPESLVLQVLRQMRGEIADLRENSASKADFATLRAELAEVRSELKSDIADVAADLLQTRKELGDQIVGLRRAVIDYHTTVIGHGMLISDPEARVRRVERHLNLPPLAAG
jgi:hypothetical protein